jgi:hypothetical protein
MSIFALPSEIFQQILSETMTFQNFTSLRLVHPHFNDTIRVSAEHLMRSLVRSQNVSDRVLSLSQQFEGIKAGNEPAEQKLSALLRLHQNVATGVRLEAVLDAHREKFVAFPIWADVPAKGFGRIESVLLFAAFQHELVRAAEVCEGGGFPRMIARANSSNDHFQWLKLDQRFADFVRDQLTVDDLQALITIVNFSAISTRFIDTILTARYYFNDARATDHWQNEQLGSALLAERILWEGPSWLAKSLHQSVTPALQQLTITAAALERTIWTGSRGEAAQLTANGVARLLWKERVMKLELERQVAETSGMETKQRRSDLRVDAAVWRGSSGG